MYIIIKKYGDIINMDKTVYIDVSPDEKTLRFYLDNTNKFSYTFIDTTTAKEMLTIIQHGIFEKRRYVELDFK